MNKDLYEKLVDMYAGKELPTELNTELEAAAAENPVLAEEMESLTLLVDSLKEIPAPLYSSETEARILRKIDQQATLNQPRSIPSYLQYPLPMQG